MKQIMQQGIFVLAIMLVLSAMLSGRRTAEASTIYLVTSFDFAHYPACGLKNTKNCIKAVRFYDADSKRVLAEEQVQRESTGQQWITARAEVPSMPRRVYAATIYLDTGGRMNQGPAGRSSEANLRR